MTRARLQVDRRASEATPAALVATWLAGELLDVEGVTFRLWGDDRVTLEAPTGTYDVRARIVQLLNESRFAGWSLVDG